MDTCGNRLEIEEYKNQNFVILDLVNNVNFQKIFSRVVSFMALSKIRENERFLKHSLLQVA